MDGQSLNVLNSIFDRARHLMKLATGDQDVQVKMEDIEKKPSIKTPKKSVKKRKKGPNRIQDKYPARDDRATFTDLPAELRNMIYLLILPNTKGRVMLETICAIRNAGVGRDYHGWHTQSETPAILRVNKQIHAEAAGIYYSQNDFHVHSGKEMDMSLPSTWLSQVPLQYVSDISLVHIVLTPCDWSRAARLLPFLDAMRVTGLKYTQIKHHVHRGFNPNVFKAFKELFTLPDKAREEGWPYQKMEIEVDKWVEARTRQVKWKLVNGPEEVEPSISEARKRGSFGLRSQTPVKYN